MCDSVRDILIRFMTFHIIIFVTVVKETNLFQTKFMMFNVLSNIVSHKQMYVTNKMQHNNQRSIKIALYNLIQTRNVKGLSYKTSQKLHNKMKFRNVNIQDGPPLHHISHYHCFPITFSYLVNDLGRVYKVRLMKTSVSLFMQTTLENNRRKFRNKN